MVNLLFFGGAFWFACIIFTIDLILPTGVAVGLGYAAVVAVGIWSPRGGYFFWSAGFGTVLTILGYLVSPVWGETWIAVCNRVLSVGMIWLAAYLGLRCRSAEK